ncbi:hypothetical protein [Thalassospira alkalitolerans]|uniref:hypothetical protein n=1 Tax=Thalassospira alkalitolerans TaxID=1293890 RepID=UPI0030ED3708|tara:strand:+ start:32209 stop:32697 length:489 start_codon:yes stop_codon:yes gene_type:complete
MIRLGAREPTWLDLVDGVRLKVRPITTPAYAMIQAQAEKVFDDWAENKAGDEGLDPTDESVRRGLMRALMIKGLAIYGVIEWEGVESLVTDDTVAAFVDEQPLLAALFYHRYLGPLEERAAEGNASGPAPHGTSVEAQNIAEGAGKTDTPAGTHASTDNTNP